MGVDAIFGADGSSTGLPCANESSQCHANVGRRPDAGCQRPYLDPYDSRAPLRHRVVLRHVEVNFFIEPVGKEFSMSESGTGTGERWNAARRGPPSRQSHPIWDGRGGGCIDQDLLTRISIEFSRRAITLSSK
jgi:hypothetical protein